jgi:lipopolysaccharide/colanic/teichoic acid biosynthesis glycosyltransferase
VTVLIKLGSSRPIFFRRRRVVCFKLQSMRVDADSDSHRRHTQELIRSQTPMVKLDARRDPWLVPFGSLLRVSGLHELTQLINVLRGRNEPGRTASMYPLRVLGLRTVALAAVRRRVGTERQVSGKNRTTFDQMVRPDIEYSRLQSLWLDLEIIVKTIPALGQVLRFARRARSNYCHEADNVQKSVESFSL